MSRLFERLVFPRSFCVRIARLLLVSVVCWTPPVCGQEASFREVILPAVDSAVPRKLEAYAEHVRAEEWTEALDFLVEIQREHADELVKVGDNRYVRVATHCANLPGKLPPAGLAVYRQRISDRTTRQLNQALAAENHDDISRLAADFPYSSAGALALQWLGESAWANDQPALARTWWNRLLTEKNLLNGASTKAISADNLRLRVAMCELAMGHRRQAAQRLKRWPREDDEAKRDRVESAARFVTNQLGSDNWPVRPGTDSARAFAGNIHRNSIFPELPRWLLPAWKYPVFPERTTPATTTPRHPALLGDFQPGLFPAVFNDHVFVSDGRRVLAFNISTGAAAWPQQDENDADSPVIFSLRSNLPDLAVHGMAASTVTIDSTGRLFARLGTPVTRIASGEVRKLTSQLVCLKINEPAPRELWRAPNSELGEDWQFDGAPLAENDRIYSVVTQANSRLQLGIVCLDAATGQAQWTQTICTALRPFGVNANSVTHLVPCLDDHHVYLSTGVGAIAALGKADGKPAWVVTYPQHNPTKPQALPSACLAVAGRLIVAAPDADEIMAFDGLTGRTVWRRRLPDSVRHLLGAHQQTLVVSGNSLWGLDVETGKVLWGGTNHDPAQFGYGRGLITRSAVLWPKRSTIEIRDLHSGRMLNAPLSLTTRGSTSGNLLLYGKNLVISGRDYLNVLAPGTPRRATDGIVY